MVAVGVRLVEDGFGSRVRAQALRPDDETADHAVDRRGGSVVVDVDVAVRLIVRVEGDPQHAAV
jgi:hypothetical protein